MASISSRQAPFYRKRFKNNQTSEKRLKIASKLGNMVSQFSKIKCERYCFLVDDEVVYELVKKKIGDFEKENKNWVIEGFPRNKNQALMVGKMGIIPDKMVLLKTQVDKTSAKIKQNLLEQDPNIQSQDLEAAIKNIHQEYNLNILGVKEVFKTFLFEIDTTNMEKE